MQATPQQEQLHHTALIYLFTFKRAQNLTNAALTAITQVPLTANLKHHPAAIHISTLCKLLKAFSVAIHNPNRVAAFNNLHDTWLLSQPTDQEQT